MIKTKLFHGQKDNPWNEKLDAQINDFLSENSVELIDIKFSSCENRTVEKAVHVSALVIYREK
jgi:hypothetical protein